MSLPKNKIGLIFLFILLCFLTKAQQFNFPDDDGIYDGMMLPGFDSRFENVNARNTISIKSTEPFRSAKVSGIRLFNSRDQLITFFELDRQGNIEGKGSLGHHYFGTSRNKCTENDTVKSEAWYSDRLLVRTDTTYKWRHVYKNADTLMEYIEYKFVVYQRGSIINERNELFARKYLNGSGKYKSNYDSSFLYLCRYENYGTEFIASVRNKFINLDTASLKEHAFFNKYKKTNTMKFYVEGEDFVEPLERSVFRCGTISPKFGNDETTFNSKGLFEKFYNSSGYLICYARYEYYDEP